MSSTFPLDVDKLRGSVALGHLTAFLWSTILALVVTVRQLLGLASFWIFAVACAVVLGLWLSFSRRIFAAASERACSSLALFFLISTCILQWICAAFTIYRLSPSYMVAAISGVISVVVCLLMLVFVRCRFAFFA